MAAVTLRSTKGSILTIQELDANFTNLNVESSQKVSVANPTFTGTVNFSDVSNIVADALEYPTFRPSLKLDFANAGVLDNRITFTRASSASQTNSFGVLEMAAINKPRFDYDPITLACKGLLIESQRTNSIRNNTQVGAVTGTPGTAPTNWFIYATSLTQEIVGIGSFKGISYIDIRISGTPTTTSVGVFLETASGIPWTDTQVFAMSVWSQIVGGSLTNISSGALFIAGYDASLVFLSGASTAAAGSSAINSTWQRITRIFTGANAALAYGRPTISLAVTSGLAIDVTLRIGLPQLELGAFVTSVIPTSTAAATRNADLATITGTNFSSWYNQDQSTIVAKIVQGVQGSAAIVSNPGLFALRTASLGATFNGYGVREVPSVSGTGSVRAAGRSGATLVETNGPVLGLLAAGTSYVAAASINASTISIAINGAAGSTGSNTVSSLLPLRDTLDIGRQFIGGSNPIELNGHVASFTYYPVSISMASLQALTT